MKNLFLKLIRKNNDMQASPDVLRTALRSADVSTLDMAIDMVVYFIHNNKLSESALNNLLAPIKDDEVFNQRIYLIRSAAGI